MPGTGHGPVRDLVPCDTAEEAVARIRHIYDTAVQRIRESHRRFASGASVSDSCVDACYPYVGIEVTPDQLVTDAQPTYGSLRNAGAHGTTVTRPDIFSSYFPEQLSLLIANHRVPVQVGVSNQPIPLPFVIEAST
ncbi:MAG: AMP nucleosidase, partial [Ectothiorhodospiraceae bacterium]|nr:AMP nucleosidase [Ectothiorhodospiraceae bacterium]